MRVVLDTSVLVAAARSRNGACFKLISQLPSKQFEIALSVALYTEWNAVLTRPENIPPGLTEEDVVGYLRYLASIACLQDIYYLWRPVLKDPDDDMILEYAVASRSEFIVTHNIRDFSGCASFGITAISPGDFLKQLRNH